MEKNWIKLGLSLCKIKGLNKEERNRLLSVVPLIIEKLEQENILKTFHFFFEPFLDLRIQVKKEEQIPKAKKITLEIIDRKLPSEKVFVYNKGGFLAGNLPNFLKYSGEEEDYGKDGWIITKKFFEISSRIALCKENEEKDKIITKNKEFKFHESKFIHLSLNQLGYSTRDEANFHLNKTIERLMKVFRGDKEKAIDHLKQTINNLKSQKI